MPQAEGLEDLPDSQDPAVGDSVGSRAISGQRLIFRMFVILAVATVVILLFFATQVSAEYRPRIYGALALNMALVVVAYYLLKFIGRRTS